VSIAEVAADGPFSPFPGVDRELLLLEGAGMRLEFADAAPVTLARRLDAARFPGEAAVNGRLLGGPTRDFNAMARRGVVQMTVAAGPLAALPALTAGPGLEWVLHLLDGEVEARGGDEAVHLGGGDSLRVAAAASSRPITFQGTGTAIQVRFAALP
ncbi:MAG TPA: HutD family protein, partial [Mizugakiibacter sp.]